jgi:hypothetical protein
LKPQVPFTRTTICKLIEAALKVETSSDLLDIAICQREVLRCCGGQHVIVAAVALKQCHSSEWCSETQMQINLLGRAYSVLIAKMCTKETSV